VLDCSELDGWGDGWGGGSWGVGESQYLGVLQSLLPRGIAWTRRNCADLTRLLAGLCEEFAEVATRSEDLFHECDPRKVFELVDEWEQAFGLPGPCGNYPTDLPGRRKAIHGKMVANRGQDVAIYQEIGAALGYTDLEFSHYSDQAFTCQSECDDFLYAGKWNYAIKVEGTSIPALDPTLKCLLNDALQIHWVFIFDLTP
jgi:uncharacterized protein YmfQ (DUF2313 family)